MSTGMANNEKRQISLYSNTSQVMNDAIDRIVVEIHNKKKKSWSYSKDGDIRELFSFNEDGSIQACLPNGEKMNVPADGNGLFQVRMAMNDGFYYAFNK